MGSVWGGFCRKQTTHTIALCRAYHLQFKSGGHNDIVQSQSSMVTMINIHSLGVRGNIFTKAKLRTDQLSNCPRKLYNRQELAVCIQKT